MVLDVFCNNWEYLCDILIQGVPFSSRHLRLAKFTEILTNPWDVNLPTKSLRALSILLVTGDFDLDENLVPDLIKFCVMQSCHDDVIMEIFNETIKNGNECPFLKMVHALGPKLYLLSKMFEIWEDDEDTFLESHQSVTYYLLCHPEEGDFFFEHLEMFLIADRLVKSTAFLCYKSKDEYEILSGKMPVRITSENRDVINDLGPHVFYQKPKPEKHPVLGDCYEYVHHSRIFYKNGIQVAEIKDINDIIKLYQGKWALVKKNPEINFLKIE